jgi:hypothetical protein
MAIGDNFFNALQLSNASKLNDGELLENLRLIIANGRDVLESIMDLTESDKLKRILRGYTESLTKDTFRLAALQETLFEGSLSQDDVRFIKDTSVKADTLYSQCQQLQASLHKDGQQKISPEYDLLQKTYTSLNVRVTPREQLNQLNYDALFALMMDDAFNDIVTNSNVRGNYRKLFAEALSGDADAEEVLCKDLSDDLFKYFRNPPNTTKEQRDIIRAEYSNTVANAPSLKEGINAALELHTKITMQSSQDLTTQAQMQAEKQSR